MNDQKDLSITQDNAIIESSLSMTLNERRLLLLLVSKVNPREPIKKPDPENPEFITLTVKDWISVYGNDGNDAYKLFKQAADKIYGKYYTLPDHHYHPNGERDIPLFGERIRYGIADEATVKFELHYKFHKRLANLLEQFTKYPLLAVTKFKSVYTIRLYELLIQFQSVGSRTLTTQNLRFALGIDPSKYKDTNNFHRKVLFKAIDELNEKSDLDVAVDQIKEKRVITQYRFRFDTKKKPQRKEEQLSLPDLDLDIPTFGK